jgi:hypothetical protein
MNNNVLLKYLCIRENFPKELHQIRSKDSQFFVNEIIKKFGKKGLYNQDGKLVSFTYIFRRVNDFEVKYLKRLMRNVRCYFNKLCTENPNKFYMKVPLIDWLKYDYIF